MIACMYVRKYINFYGSVAYIYVQLPDLNPSSVATSPFLSLSHMDVSSIAST